MLIEGEEEEPGPLARSLNEGGYLLPPLPNLFFTRDTAMVVGEHVMIGSMRYPVRWSEELIMKLLFLHHPLLANKGILYDGAAERRHNYTLEGGDVHPLRDDTVIIGFSERSSPAAHRLSDVPAVRGDVDHERHRRRHAEGEHGDPSRHDLHAARSRSVRRCIRRTSSVRSGCRFCTGKKGNDQMREMPNVFAALEHVGLPMDAGVLRRRRAARCRSASSGRADATSSRCDRV